MIKQGIWRIWVGLFAFALFVYYFQPTFWWRALAGLVVLIFSRRFVLALAEDFLFWALDPLIRKFEDPQHPFNPCYKSFVIRETFAGKTAGGFKVLYEVDAICVRVVHLRFKRAGLVGNDAQRALVRDFHQEVILPVFAERRYCFGLELRSDEELAKRKMETPFRTPIIQLTKANGTTTRREVADSAVSDEIAREPILRKHGCNVRFHALYHDYLSDELIEENYAMLDDEEKKAIETDPRFNALEERMAVAVLKRRLDFLGRQSNQKHEAEMFSIETEKVGRSVRIRWKLKAHAPEGYELLGFRKTGGYFADQFDIKQNGEMVTQSRKDDEAIEPLNEGETSFYTFFLVSLQPSEDGRRKAYSPLRFRLTVSTKDETEAIESLLQRIEERTKPDPAKENMSQALKELGLVMEFDEAVDEMEKSLIERIKKKNLPKGEEEEKIEFVRDAARLQRDKYQP